VLVAASAPATLAEGSAARCDDVELDSIVVPVRYKPVSDAARLVDQLLGPCGAYRVPKALGVITVEDEPERLERIADAVASWDAPPRSVEVTVSLIMARREEGAAGEGFVGEIRGVTETLSEVTAYTTFERIATATIVASEGRDATIDLGGRYRASFRVGAVDTRRGIVQLEPFSLERVPGPGEVASGMPRRVRRLLSADLDLPEGQLHLVGAPGRDREKAIFLALKVWSVDGPGERPVPAGGESAPAARED
jgi:hypothetical protein